MYVRTTPRRNKDGSVVRYLQLAHNVWDPVKKRSRTEVLYNFGREDAESRAALERLAGSLARFLAPRPIPRRRSSPAPARASTSSGSRPLGGSYVLDGLWRRLGIDATLRRLLKGRAPRRRCRARALRARRQPRPGALLEARRRALGLRGRAHRRPLRRPPTTPATARWTGCSRSSARSSARSSTRSPACSASRSTCSSSTPPRPTSSATRPMSPWRATSAGSCWLAEERERGRAPGRLPQLRPLQGPPGRPAPGGRRHGRDPRGHPRARLVAGPATPPTRPSSAR